MLHATRSSSLNDLTSIFFLTVDFMQHLFSVMIIVCLSWVWYVEVVELAMHKTDCILFFYFIRQIAFVFQECV